MRFPVAGFLVCVLVGTVRADLTSTTVHGPEFDSLDANILVGDALSGLIASELAGDNGWHPANPASGNPSDPNGLAAFTDDIGAFSSVTGLLNDFPGAGLPAKRIQYDFVDPIDIARIQILSGNAGKDGRVFSTTVVSYSSDSGANFTQLGYFQSDPSGTVNDGSIGSTLVSIFDDAGAALLNDVTNLQFELYAVDNTGGQMRDPFDGLNAFTGIDDGLTAAFVSPLIYELDVAPVPEPSALVIALFLASGTWFLRFSRRKRSCPQNALT